MGQSDHESPFNLTGAIDDQSPVLEGVRASLDLPQNAKFCGFLIYALDTSEFLHKIVDFEKETNRAFVDSPEQALRFRRFDEVRQLVRQDQGEAIVAMFEVADQHVMAVLIEGSASTGATIH